MSKSDMIQYLMTRYNVSFNTAFDALTSNGYNLMLAAGDIRDSI